MPDSLEEAMRFGIGTALPEDGLPPAGPGTPGSSSGAPRALPGCVCSCEGIASLGEAAADARARQESGGAPDINQLKYLSTCYTECADEVIACTTGN